MLQTGLERAIAAAGGTQAALAARIGFTQQAVALWAKAGKVSRGGALAIEAELGIPRSDLRPDLYAEVPAPAPAERDAA